MSRSQFGFCAMTWRLETWGPFDSMTTRKGDCSARKSVCLVAVMFDCEKSSPLSSKAFWKSRALPFSGVHCEAMTYVTLKCMLVLLSLFIGSMFWFPCKKFFNCGSITTAAARAELLTTLSAYWSYVNN